MAANFDITVERVGDDVIRVDVLGTDPDGRRVALIGRLVGEAAEEAVHSWPGVTLPSAPDGRVRPQP